MAVPYKEPVIPFVTSNEPVKYAIFKDLSKVKSPVPEVTPASLNWIDLSGPAGAAVAVIPVSPEPSP